MAADAVGQGAADRREQENGNLASEGDESEERRRLREPVHQPRLRDLLHPGAGERDELAAEEELVVVVTERSEEVIRFVNCQFLMVNCARARPARVAARAARSA